MFSFIIKLIIDNNQFYYELKKANSPQNLLFMAENFALWLVPHVSG